MTLPPLLRAEPPAAAALGGYANFTQIHCQTIFPMGCGEASSLHWSYSSPPVRLTKSYPWVDPRASGGGELESAAVSAESHARWKIMAPLKQRTTYLSAGTRTDVEGKGAGMPSRPRLSR